MKINKNIIKELTEYLNEFNLTEIEYTEKDIKVKVSKLSGANVAAVKEIKSEIKTENIKIDNVSGTEVPSPIIGTAYLAPEPGGKKFVEGMVVAIEPMINMGTEKIVQLKDGWTILTKDGKPSAHFEHDVAIVNGKPELLSTFKYIYDALGISSNEEDEFRAKTLS